MKNITLLLGTLIGTVVLVVVVAFVFSKKASTPIDPVKLLGDARLATGSAQPKATIVEFSDLQCPACKASEPVVRQIVEKNKEMVKLVYRQFPLTQHQYSRQAALAAETVASVSVEKFWQFHDIMFDKQEEWSSLKPEEINNTFGSYAESIGVPSDLIKTSIDQKTFESKVDQDLSDGTAIGVAATPTFYVNGEKVQVANLQQVVEKIVQQ